MKLSGQRRVHATWSAVFLVLVAPLGMWPSGLATDVGDCETRQEHRVGTPFTVSGVRTYDCLDLRLEATITVPAGATLIIANSTLNVTGAGAIHVMDGGKAVLNATTWIGDPFVVDEGGSAHQILPLQVHVTSPSGSAAPSLWAWDSTGLMRVPAQSAVDVGEEQNAVLFLPIAAWTGSETLVLPSWHVVARTGGAANVTLFEQLPQEPGPAALAMVLESDDDTEAPRWDEAADLRAAGGARYMATTTLELVWNPANDTNVAHPNRAVDHYEIRHAAPGGVLATYLVGSQDAPRLLLEELAAGLHAFEVRPFDLVGNAGPFAQEAQVTVDLQRPALSGRAAPSVPGGDNGWHVRKPTVTAEASDAGGSGLKAVSYRLSDAAAWLPYDGPFEIDQSGDHLVELRATDGAGNEQAVNLRIRVDLEPPVVSLKIPSATGKGGWHTSAVNVQLSQGTEVSGIRSTEYRIGGGTWLPFQGPLVLQHAGVHDLWVRATDRAGNEAAEIHAVVSIDTSPPLAPAPNWEILFDGRVRLDWTAQPPTDLVSGVARAYFERGTNTGEVLARIEVAPGEPIHTLGPLPVGQHWFRVTVEDQAGLAASSAWHAARITQSLAGLHGLAKELRVRGVVDLAFHPVGEFSAVEVQYRVDDVLIATSAAGELIHSWDTKLHGDGFHEVIVTGIAADGTTQRHVQMYEVRNGYAATLVDSLPAALTAAAVLLVVVALGMHGLRAWPAWQRSHEGSGSLHAVSRHVPSHATFEAAKALHLVCILAGGALAVLAFATPRVVGPPAFSWTLDIALLAGGFLCMVQMWLLAFLFVRKRRLAAAPHLQRITGQALEFDAPAPQSAHPSRRPGTRDRGPGV